VNDLERDLREVLHQDARRVPTPASAPEGLRRSARRRQAVFGGAVALAGLAIVAGIVAGATTLLPSQSGPEPAALEPTTTGTLNGITITYPGAWHLIDPDQAALNGSPTMGESPLPRIVLALAPTEAPETFGCPGRANAGESAPLLMTVQEEPPAPTGPASSPWPVELRSMNVDASESACYPGWEFMHAEWSASSRTFEARVGFGPDASDEERDGLFAAFASMTFEPSEGSATSVELARGTAGGEEWQLSASRAKGGLSIELAGESTSSGMGLVGDTGVLGDIQASATVFGSGSRAERVIFGVVPEALVRVEASSPGRSTVSADVLELPSEIAQHLNAFVLVVDPSGPVQLTGYDGSGQAVATGSVGGSAQAPSPAATALEDGRHFGYVRSVDPDASTIEFDLAYFLSGQEANDAYHAAGGTGPVPNDHFVVNDNPMLRTLALAPDVRLRLLDWNHCCETFFDADLSLFGQAIKEQADITDGDLIYRGQSSWWITIENGVVTEIEEQYSP
jgi:hypothetical protein